MAKRKTIAKKRSDPTKRAAVVAARAAHDDKEITALKLKPAKLSPAMADYF